MFEDTHGSLAGTVLARAKDADDVDDDDDDDDDGDDDDDDDDSDDEEGGDDNAQTVTSLMSVHEFVTSA